MLENHFEVFQNTHNDVCNVICQSEIIKIILKENMIQV